MIQNQLQISGTLVINSMNIQQDPQELKKQFQKSTQILELCNVENIADKIMQRVRESFNNIKDTHKHQTKQLNHAFFSQYQSQISTSRFQKDSPLQKESPQQKGSPEQQYIDNKIAHSLPMDILPMVLSVPNLFMGKTSIKQSKSPSNKSKIPLNKINLTSFSQIQKDEPISPIQQINKKSFSTQQKDQQTLTKSFKVKSKFPIHQKLKQQEINSPKLEQFYSTSPTQESRKKDQSKSLKINKQKNSITAKIQLDNVPSNKLSNYALKKQINQLSPKKFVLQKNKQITLDEDIKCSISLSDRSSQDVQKSYLLDSLNNYLRKYSQADIHPFEISKGIITPAQKSPQILQDQKQIPQQNVMQIKKSPGKNPPIQTNKNKLKNNNHQDNQICSQQFAKALLEQLRSVKMIKDQFYKQMKN